MPFPSLPSWLKGSRRFEPGTISISAGAQEALRSSPTRVEDLIARHCCGDFGELPENDRQANESAIVHGGYITSIYRVPRLALGLAPILIWVYTNLRERWTYVCIESEVGNLI